MSPLFDTLFPHEELVRIRIRDRTRQACCLECGSWFPTSGQRVLCGLDCVEARQRRRTRVLQFRARRMVA